MTGSFYTYVEYTTHMDSEEHKQVNLKSKFYSAIGPTILTICTGWSKNWVIGHCESKNDVIYSKHIYASCFSAMMWGKLCKVFVIVTSLS